MAMLAEPRRKQKWSVDPRNSAWSKDESKFGQKMLEKMGWSKGKGLGAQEQGHTEHIRVQVKNNTLGLGAPANHEDNWIAQQDEFNQLLADLNGCHGQETPEIASGGEKKTFSLEEKSKTSRKRVHYMKFAKGKDLSSRSEEDLSCIFGKRQINKIQVDGAKTAALEESPMVVEESPEQVDALNTVTSALTVQEYFAKRMAKLKKAQSDIDIGQTALASMIAEKSGCLKTQLKKKKSRKYLELEKESRIKAESPEIVDSSGGEEGNLEAQKKKRKKKRKKSKHHSSTCNEFPNSIQEKGFCFSGASDTENNEREVPIPMGKDMKKHQKRNRDRTESVRSTKTKKKERSS